MITGNKNQICPQAYYPTNSCLLNLAIGEIIIQLSCFKFLFFQECEFCFLPLNGGFFSHNNLLYFQYFLFVNLFFFPVNLSLVMILLNSRFIYSLLVFHEFLLFVNLFLLSKITSTEDASPALGIFPSWSEWTMMEIFLGQKFQSIQSSQS